MNRLFKCIGMSALILAIGSLSVPTVSIAKHEKSAAARKKAAEKRAKKEEKKQAVKKKHFPFHGK